MNKDYYISLLIKKWKEGLSTLESDELNGWLESSSDNRLLSDEMQKAWKKAGVYELPFDINENEAFDTIWGKLQGSDRTVKQLTRVGLGRYWMSLAAGVAILVLAAWFLLSREGNVENIIILASLEIHQIILPDGSEAWLRKGSQLSYPERFNSDERLLFLEGEAFFDVKRNTHKPFVIKTAMAGLEVLGTSFNVKAIENQPIEVAVKTGEVRLSSLKSTDYVDISAKQRGILNQELGKLEVINDENLNALAWQRQRLIFRDTPLHQVIDDLALFYKVEINLTDETMANCPFTGRFDTSRNVEELLTEISTLFKMDKFKLLADGIYSLNGGLCK